MHTDRKQLMTPAEVAAEMRVSVDTVLRLVRSGRLRGHKFGKQWRIALADLEAYLAASSSRPGGPVNESPTQG